MKMPDGLEHVSLHLEAGALRITLNRPKRLNSFNTAMHAELREVISQVATTEGTVRCILLTGSGRAFSAGQDLADLDLEQLGDVVERDYNPLIRRIASLDMPVIAAVNGVAAGAGCNIALACDIVLAARSARFIQSFEQLGLVPDAGGTWILPRLIGHARATAMVMTGEAVSAEQAEAWGMIWRAVDDDALARESEALATRLAGRATIGHAHAKRLLRLSSTSTLDQQLDLERDFQQAASNTDDFREGVNAFLEKREPLFKGR